MLLLRKRIKDKTEGLMKKCLTIGLRTTRFKYSSENWRFERYCDVYRGVVGFFIVRAIAIVFYLRLHYEHVICCTVWTIEIIKNNHRFVTVGGILNYNNRKHTYDPSSFYSEKINSTTL